MNYIDKSDLPVVTSDRFFTDSNYEKIDEDGLLSQRIFGPVRSYKCACGTLNAKTLHKGKTCPKCGVVCTTSNVRYKNFAKIILPLPIYTPTTPNMSLLNGVVKKQHKHILDPLQADLSLSTDCYLEWIGSKDKLQLVDTYDAIEKTIIPLSIHGTYTLYLAVICAWQCYGSSLAKEIATKCFSYELLVTPPETRHYYVRHQDGNVVIKQHQVNQLYHEILRLHNYDWTQIIHPDKIRNKYLQSIKDALDTPNIIDDDNLRFYDHIVCKYQYYTNKIYDEIVKELSYKQGFIRKDFLGRSVDFSARAHIVPDPSLNAHQIKLPKSVFMRLWFIEYLRYTFRFKNQKLENILSAIKITESNITSNEFPEFMDDFIEYFFKDESDDRNKIVLINRQPTLWRYGIPAVKVVGISSGNVIGVSPLLLECMNGDFDGDTEAIYRIHDTTAQNELKNTAYFMNCIKYDHNDSYIQGIRIEAVYAAHYLLSSKINSESDIISIDSLSELPYEFEDILDTTKPVQINGKIYSYGVCLFNKWCDFKDIIIDHFVKSDEISDYLYKNSSSNAVYQKKLGTLMRKLFWYSTVNIDSVLTLNIKEICSLNLSNERQLMTKLPENPYIGQHLYKAIVERLYDQIPNDHIFKRLISANLGKVKTQLSRMVGAIGYVADNNNIVSSKALTNTVFNGLDPDIFFQTAFGSRKGIVDKSNATPASGYLERTMVLNLSPVEICEDDCGSNRGFSITVENKKHAKSLINRYYWVEGGWNLLTPDKIESVVGKTLVFRSPLTCQSKDFKICKKCFGNYDLPTPYVGILAGQYISERMTQLSMRTFHTSGSCTLETDPEIVNFLYKNLVNIEKYDGYSHIVLSNPVPESLKDKFRKVGIDSNNKIPTFNNLINNDHTLVFDNIYNVKNHDVTDTIDNIKEILNKERGNVTPVEETYQNYIHEVLKVGDIYSSFVEVVLCNMYLTKEGELLRYALKKNINAIPYQKLSIKRICTIVSKLLSLLFEPNTSSIGRFSPQNDNKIPDQMDTIFEKLWVDNFLS